MEEEKKINPTGEEHAVAMPRIRSEYSHLFEDNDEDPYEQIFRRAEDPDEETVGGMPVNKDAAVAGLFEQPEALPEEPKIPKVKTPKAKERKKTEASGMQTVRAQVAELLKRWRKPAPGVPLQEEKTADVPAAAEQTAAEVPVESVQVSKPVMEEATAPEVDEKDYLPAEVVDENEPVLVFVRKKPEKAEEAPAEAEYTEEKADAPKVNLVMETKADDGADDEPVIVFAPVEAEPAEGANLMSHTEDEPGVNPMMKTEAENEIEEEAEEDEPVIVFAPVEAEPEEGANLMSHTGDVPKVIPVTETEAEDETEEDEPVIVFAPVEPAESENTEQMSPPEASEDTGEVPEEPPAWNVKVEIPEEIKDVEGKLKIVSVEELPIHIFTEAQQEMAEPKAPEIPVPDFDTAEQKAPEAEKPEEIQPEAAAEVPQETPEAPVQEEAEEPTAEPEEPPQPICVQWPEETFRPYRGKEIKVISKERMYDPVEKEYQRMVAPGRKKKKQERRRQKRQEVYRLLKAEATEKAIRARDCAVACAKKTAHSLHPKVVYGKVKNIAVSTAETGTYKVSAMLQLIAAGLAGLVLLALLIVNKYNISLQVELSQYKVPVLFASIHAIAVGAVLLLSFRTTVGGTISLFTRHCDRGTDGLVSLLLWFSLAQSVLSIFFHGEILRGEVSLYAPVCMLVLFMDAWGKLLNHQRVSRAVKLLDSAPGAESAGVLLEDTELQTKVDANVPDRLTVVRMAETDREAFIRNAVRRDGSQKVMRLMTGPLVLAAVLIGALEFSVSGSWMRALAACTAVLCVSAPLSMTMCMTVPALRGGKRMHKAGAAAASWDAAANFGEVGCVVVRDEDLFPDSAMKLINVKVIRERLLETSVVSAAAVLHRTGGPLRRVFDRILTGEVDSMPKAERVRTEETGGVVGWVNGLRIIIGKGEMLQKYGIQPPSRDYESKNCPEGKQFVYLAAGGELVAMFVLEYRVDPEVKQTVQTLSNTGCDLAVCTADANLRKEFLASCFDLDEDGVELLNDTELQAQAEAEEDTRNQLILHRGGVSLFAALTACIRMKGAMELASALQFAGVLLGILLIVVFSATGAIYQLSNLVICLFELFWLTAVLVIPALRRI